jgi:hypothetical protein
MVKSISNQRAAFLGLTLLAFIVVTIRILWHPFRDNFTDESRTRLGNDWNRTYAAFTTDSKPQYPPPVTFQVLKEQIAKLSSNASTIKKEKVQVPGLNSASTISVTVNREKVKALQQQIAKLRLNSSTLTKEKVREAGLTPASSTALPFASSSAASTRNHSNSMTLAVLKRNVSAAIHRLIQHQNSFPSRRNAFVSPYEGTDIESNPSPLLKEFNQTQIIIPQLQLVKDYKVYFCQHKENGVRFFFLTREGLLLHPRIHLVDDPNAADYIVYLPVSAGWHETECNKAAYRGKTVILDEGDGPGLFTVNDGIKDSWVVYFKRSFVSRHRGIFQGYMRYVTNGNVFPMTYPSGDIYVRPRYNSFDSRDLEIVCTLRGSNHDPVRLRVREWIEEYVRARGIKQAVAGEINHESRRTISKAYFDNMYRARIVVTSNPSGWEGGELADI